MTLISTRDRPFPQIFLAEGLTLGSRLYRLLRFSATMGKRALRCTL